MHSRGACAARSHSKQEPQQHRQQAAACAAPPHSQRPDSSERCHRPGAASTRLRRPHRPPRPHLLEALGALHRCALRAVLHLLVVQLHVLHKRGGVQQARVAAGAAPVGRAGAALLAQQGQRLGQLAHPLLPLLRAHGCGGVWRAHDRKVRVSKPMGAKTAQLARRPSAICSPAPLSHPFRLQPWRRFQALRWVKRQPASQPASQLASLAAHPLPSWPPAPAAACAAPPGRAAARRTRRQSSAPACCRRRRRPQPGGPPSAQSNDRGT